MLMGLLLILLTACTPMVYSVPQPTWAQMSEPERTEAMAIYNQRQIARQQAIAEQNRRQAMYLEQQRRQQAVAAENRRQRVESIYRGDGNYGDLLRIRIEKGMADFHGQIREYDPVAFQIANGETKSITVATTKRRTVVLEAYYDGATLYLDGNSNSRKARLSQLHYDQRWSRGLTYSAVYTNNRAKLKGAEVTIEIVGESRHGNHYQSSGSTTIIINERPVERTIVHEQPKRVINHKQPVRINRQTPHRQPSNRQQRRYEQLKNERLAIEKQNKEVRLEQEQLESEQLSLEKERKDLAEDRTRIRKMKREAARDKKQTTREQRMSVRESEQAVKQLEDEIKEKEEAIAKKDQIVVKKNQQVKEKNQQVNQREKEFVKGERKLKKEEKESDKKKEEKQS
jgi:hypothetical protein